MSEIDETRGARARAAVSARLGDVWWAFMLRGVLAALLGCLALFWPTDSVAWLLRIAGFFLILDGMTAVFSYRQLRGEQAGLAQGALTLLFGALLLFLPEGSIRLAFVLLGLWALLTGAGYLWTGYRMPRDDPERTTALSVGSMGAGAGLVLLLWPGTGVVAIGWLVALASFIVAVILIWIALRLKRVHDRLGSG